MITANMRHMYGLYELQASIFRENYFMGHLSLHGFDYTSTVKKLL